MSAYVRMCVRTCIIPYSYFISLSCVRVFACARACVCVCVNVFACVRVLTVATLIILANTNEYPENCYVA